MGQKALYNVSCIKRYFQVLILEIHVNHEWNTNRTIQNNNKKLIAFAFTVANGDALPAIVFTCILLWPLVFAHRVHERFTLLVSPQIILGQTLTRARDRRIFLSNACFFFVFLIVVFLVILIRVQQT